MSRERAILEARQITVTWSANGFSNSPEVGNKAVALCEPRIYLL
jgi:hypothetical protein